MRTTRRTPASSAAASTFAVPSTLTDRIASRDDWIGSAAAACTTTSAPATRRRASRSTRMSPRTSSTPSSSSRSSRAATSSVRTAPPASRTGGGRGGGRGSRHHPRSRRVSPRRARHGPHTARRFDGRRPRVDEHRRDEQDEDCDGALPDQAPPQATRCVATLESGPDQEVVHRPPTQRDRDDRSLTSSACP